MTTSVLLIIWSLFAIFIFLVIIFTIRAKFRWDKIVKGNNGEIIVATPVSWQWYIKKWLIEWKRTLNLKNNIKQEGNYHLWKKNWIRKITNKDGSYVMITYKDDIQEWYSEVYSNKWVKIIEWYFINNKKEWEWKCYTNTGKIKFAPTYKNDTIISSIAYNEEWNTSYVIYVNWIPNTNQVIFANWEDLYIHVLRQSTTTYIADKAREKSVYLKDIKPDSISVVCDKFENINERYYNIVIYKEWFDIANPIFEKNIVFDWPNHFTDNKIWFIINDLHSGNYKVTIIILDKDKNIIWVSNQVSFSLLT